MNHSQLMELEQSLRWPYWLPESLENIGNLTAKLLEEEAANSRSDRNQCIPQLKGLLNWAVEHSSFYRQFHSQAQTLLDADQPPQLFWEKWQKLPVLNKATLRQYNAEVHTSLLPPGHHYVDTLSTSGSTGIPVEVHKTQIVAKLWDAITLREHLWRKRDFKKRLGVIRHRPRQFRVKEGEQFANWGAPVSPLFPTGPAAAIHIGFPINQLASWLQRFNPHYLLTYPSVAKGLFELIGSSKPSALEEIRFMSEPVDPDFEAALTSTWKVKVADTYSCNEAGNLAFRCEHNRLHVQSESVLLELLDTTGLPVKPGNIGYVTITVLHNFMTPLIRYQLGDMAIEGTKCSCGRSSMVLEKVLGRERNLATRPDGLRYWPTGLGKLKNIKPIKQVQYVQRQLDTIEIHVVLSRDLTAQELQLVGQKAQEAFKFPFKFQLIKVPKISHGPTGKFEEFLSLL